MWYCKDYIVFCINTVENCNTGKLHILKFKCVMLRMMHCKKCRLQIKHFKSTLRRNYVVLNEWCGFSVLFVDMFFVLSSLIFSQSKVIKVMA